MNSEWRQRIIMVLLGTLVIVIAGSFFT